MPLLIQPLFYSQPYFSFEYIKRWGKHSDALQNDDDRQQAIKVVCTRLVPRSPFLLSGLKLNPCNS